jgi:hypothetical protein
MKQLTANKLSADHGGDFGGASLPSRLEDTFAVWVPRLDLPPVELATALARSEVSAFGKIVVEDDERQLTIYLAPECGGHSDIAAEGSRLWDQRMAENPELRYRNWENRGGGFFEFKEGAFVCIVWSHSRGHSSARS